jgi:hypothetical protein
MLSTMHGARSGSARHGTITPQLAIAISLRVKSNHQGFVLLVGLEAEGGACKYDENGKKVRGIHFPKCTVSAKMKAACVL